MVVPVCRLIAHATIEPDEKKKLIRFKMGKIGCETTKNNGPTNGNAKKSEPNA